jgi:hypothetical protein
MSVSPKIKVVGPFAPKDFSKETGSAAGTLGDFDTSGTLSYAMSQAVSGIDGSTLYAVEPIMVLGNVYLVVTTI